MIKIISYITRFFSIIHIYLLKQIAFSMTTTEALHKNPICISDIFLTIVQDLRESNKSFLDKILLERSVSKFG